MRRLSVKTFAPATLSNLGPGFDILGVAIHGLGDVVVARRRRETGLFFSVLPADSGVPPGAKQNVAGYVASMMMREFRLPFGIELTLSKAMPIGSGLGSSAASSVAAAVAVNALLPHPLKKSDLLCFALEGERFACGSNHADNAAPSLLGGGCLIRSYDPLDIVPLKIVPSLVWVVIHPHVVVLTKKARTMLPGRVPLRSAVQQSGNVAGLVMGLADGNYRLIARSVEDTIVEPLRARLIPGFYNVKEAALAAGALGCSISGSGPSVFAIAPSIQKARVIGSAMTEAFMHSARISSDVFTSRTNTRGASVLWRRER